MSDDALVDALRELVDEHDPAPARHLESELRAIDSSVRRYHRQLAGREPWPVFEPPASVVSDPAYLAEVERLRALDDHDELLTAPTQEAA